MRYLNSKPLIHGHDEEVSFETPASLADGLRAGRLDVALAPIFELIAHPGYLVVDDVAIASRGPVFSVFIAYQGELAGLRTLYLDTASRTSANLQRVLLAEFHGLTPAQRAAAPAGRPPDVLRDGEGALLIGDPAIDFRLAHGRPLPLSRSGRGVAAGDGPAVRLRGVAGAPGHAGAGASGRTGCGPGARQGRRGSRRSWPAETRYPAGLSRRYLTERIRFRLGRAGKAGDPRVSRGCCASTALVTGAAFEEPRWI